MAKKVEEVRDGFLGDLPEEVRVKVMNIHKVIVDKIRAEYKLPKYNNFNNTSWAKAWVETFLEEPSDKNHIGSVRVYKKGKKYRCMIQISGHVTNQRNSEEEEYFHGMIRNAFTAIKPIVRRKYDCTLTCESMHGEPFEGFDIWTKQKVAEQIWNLFEDKKIKKVQMESVEEDISTDVLVLERDELPEGLQDLLYDTESFLNEIDDSYGYTEIINRNESYEGSIYLGDKFVENIDADKFYNENPCKFLCVNESNELMIELSEEYAKLLYEYCCDNEPSRTFIKLPGGKYQVSAELLEKMKKCAGKECEEKEKKPVVITPYTNKYANVISEAKEQNVSVGTLSFTLVPDKTGKQYDVYHNDEYVDTIDAANYRVELDQLVKDYNITESTIYDPYLEAAPLDIEAQGTLSAIFKQIINKSKQDGYKITSTTTKTIENIITDKFLKEWAPGYNKFHIILDSYQSFHTFEFRIPKLSDQDLKDLMKGNIGLDGLFLKNREINVKMSPRIFHTMKDSKQGTEFFKAAIRYYTKGAKQYTSLMKNAFAGNKPEILELVSNSKLNKTVTMMIQSLYSFDDVSMDKKVFVVDREEIKKMTDFVKDVYSKYDDPKKDKNKVIADIKQMVKSFHESFDDIQFGGIIDEIQSLHEGKYNEAIADIRESYKNDQEDVKWITEATDPDIKYYQEKFGVKKLKKIPRDIVAYITIEAECIKDGNDKMMIASYCLSKIEIVEWYIELLETGSNKYVVPHPKSYLESLRTQLLACYKKIMDTPIPKADRSIITINGLPKGYEG